MRPKLVLLAALLACSGACGFAAQASTPAGQSRAQYLGSWTGSALARPSNETRPADLQVVADTDPNAFVVMTDPPLRFERGGLGGILVLEPRGKPTGVCKTSLRPSAGSAQLEGEFLILNVTLDAAWACPGLEAATGESKVTYTLRRAAP